LPTGMFIIFQTVSPICKMFAPLKHITMAESFFTVLAWSSEMFC
jgi:hypothetical protein